MGKNCLWNQSFPRNFINRRAKPSDVLSSHLPPDRWLRHLLPQNKAAAGQSLEFGMSDTIPSARHKQVLYWIFMFCFALKKHFCTYHSFYFYILSVGVPLMWMSLRISLESAHVWWYAIRTKGTALKALCHLLIALQLIDLVSTLQSFGGGLAPRPICHRAPLIILNLTFGLYVILAS